MFNPYDFENINKEPDTIPDGVVNASDYHELLKQVTEFMKATDYEDSGSRMVAMMNVINLFHDDEETINENNLYGVVISCMYHIQTLMSGMEEDDRKEYFKIIQEDVFPEFEEQSKTLPYYESDLGGYENE